MCHDSEEWCKIWGGIDLLFENWHKKFDKFWPKHLEVSKIYTLLGSFPSKYIMFYLKKYSGAIFHETEEWCKIWRKTDLWFGKWQEKFGNFSLEHLHVSKLGLYGDLFIQNRKCMRLKFAEKVLRRFCKIWGGIDMLFQNWHEEFDEVWPELSKVSKICT